MEANEMSTTKPAKRQARGGLAAQVRDTINGLHRLRTLHLFSGAGGGILADLLLGHRPVCAVEINPYRQQVLHARQQDGILPWFPIYPDVAKFKGIQWRGLIDIVAGGFPCQNVSVAGDGSGVESGIKSGLWREMFRVVSEIRPRYVFVENSPALTIRGMGIVMGDLASLGYDAKWGVFSAADVGARHERARIWIVAHAIKIRRQIAGLQTQFVSQRPQHCELNRIFRTTRKADKCPYERGSDAMAEFVDRLEAVGDGQVSEVAALAWRLLSAD